MADHEDPIEGEGGSEGEFDVPEGMRAVPVADIGHPLADRVGAAADGEGWVVTETRAPVVFLNQSRASLLTLAARDRRRPVLMSDELSVLTPVFATVWRRAGGVWVVRDTTGGLRNGFDGRRLGQLEDAWRLPPPTEVEDLAVNHLRPVALETMQVQVIVSIRHPARDGTVLGAAVEGLAGALDSTVAAWGSHEPVGRPWDRAALTKEVRDRMPGESAVFAVAPGLSAVLSAQRTRHGIEEMVQAHLDLGQTDAAGFERIRDRLSEVLRSLATSSMPLVAVVLARPGRQGSLVPPYLVAPPIPLAALVGAPAVRGFGLDVEDQRSRFGAEIVGRARIPALLYDLGPFQPEAWARLDGILASFDPVLLAEAFGRAGDAIDAQRPARDPHAPDSGGRDAQP